jgi:hypothetical protein
MTDAMHQVIPTLMACGTFLVLSGLINDYLATCACFNAIPSLRTYVSVRNSTNIFT